MRVKGVGGRDRGVVVRGVGVDIHWTKFSLIHRVEQVYNNRKLHITNPIKHL